MIYNDFEIIFLIFYYLRFAFEGRPDRVSSVTRRPSPQPQLQVRSDLTNENFYFKHNRALPYQTNKT